MYIKWKFTIKDS